MRSSPRRRAPRSRSPARGPAADWTSRTRGSSFAGTDGAAWCARRPAVSTVVIVRVVSSLPVVLSLLSTEAIRARSYNPPDDGLAEAAPALDPDPPAAGRDHRADDDRRLRGVALAGPRADR